jgi:catechol 2,3-dioxygenase-like lactoylglutathione lyase family enzyme
MSPILDLLSLVLEVSDLDRAEVFYGQLLGLRTVLRNDEKGVLVMEFTSKQTLELWKPVTRQHNEPRLAHLRARGGSRVHYAMQIPVGTRDEAKKVLNAHGVPWQEINLGDESQPDLGLYFFDPFGHGLELREVRVETSDQYAPLVPVGTPRAQPYTLPIVGLREVALAFSDYTSMLERLPKVYGFALAKEQPDRDFAQFTLHTHPEPDGNHTPRRWLYAWDPQVGLANMFGGEHATVRFAAQVDSILESVRDSGLEYSHDELGLAVRDPEGHVFEFLESLPTTDGARG